MNSRIQNLTLALITVVLLSCNSTKNDQYVDAYPDVKIVGAMKNVMWKGELGGIIDLDTIADKTGLYGLGPVSYLTGELLINNGKSYVSRVDSPTTMTVEKTFTAAAPFFVYANVSEWKEFALSPEIKTINDLEKYISDATENSKRPFAFKLIGHVSSAIIHVQNLPKGSKVSSPEEAHQGQTNYNLKDEAAEIIGFFSKKHKGIFTHHDSFLHMHLITKDERYMGHLDELEIREMKLFLPVR